MPTHMIRGGRGFEPRRRVRLALALALAILSIGSTLYAQDRGKSADQGLPAYRRIEPPRDPEAVAGTWWMGEERRSMTAGEFHRMHVLLSKLEGTSQRAVPPRKVWEHVLLVDEARGLGLEVTDQALDEKLLVDDPEIYEGLVARWRAQEVTPEEGRAYQREKLLIAALKDLGLNSLRITTQQIFDRFKERKLQYKMKYVRFAADDHIAQLEAQPVDETRLRTYWTETPLVQNEFREPERLTAEILYLDRSSMSMDEAQRLAPDREVTRDQALAFFWDRREELMRAFPPEKRHLLEFDENTPLDEIVSPFSVLEDSIRKRLVVEGVVREAREALAAAGPEADAKQIARRFGLGYERLDDLDRSQALLPLRRFGFNAYNLINAVAVGEVSAEVLDENQLSWFFRVLDKKAARLPRYEEVADRLKTFFVERTAYDMARDRARRAMQELSEAVEAEIADEKTRLEQEAEEVAERRIVEKGLSGRADRQRELMRARAEGRRQIEELKATRLPEFFDAWIADTELEVRETPWFEFDATRTNRMEVEDPEERRLSFFKTNYYVRNLAPGQVTAILLDDPVTRSLYIGKMVDRKDPDISAMRPVDAYRARAQETALRESRFLQDWQYAQVTRRLGFELGAADEEESR